MTASDDDLEATRLAEYRKLEDDTGFDVFRFPAELHALRGAVNQLSDTLAEVRGKVERLTEKVQDIEGALGRLKSELEPIAQTSVQAAKLLGTIDLMLAAMNHGRKL